MDSGNRNIVRSIPQRSDGVVNEILNVGEALNASIQNPSQSYAVVLNPERIQYDFKKEVPWYFEERNLLEPRPVGIVKPNNHLPEGSSGGAILNSQLSSHRFSPIRRPPSDSRRVPSSSATRSQERVDPLIEQQNSASIENVRSFWTPARSASSTSNQQQESSPTRRLPTGAQQQNSPRRIGNLTLVLD